MTTLSGRTRLAAAVLRIGSDNQYCKVPCSKCLCEPSLKERVTEMPQSHYHGSVTHLPVPTSHIVRKIEYSSLTDFLEDVKANGVVEVHMDVVAAYRPSELSFVHYVDLILYVTATEEPPDVALYEYSEIVGSCVSTDGKATDASVAEQGSVRIDALRTQLEGAGFTVQHGRVTEVIWSPERIE
jgi:hypothetical protein